MKKFTNPEMELIEFKNDEVIATSVCSQSFACTSCYCGLVQGCPPYNCGELQCATLSNY